MNLQASYIEHIQSLQASYERALETSGWTALIIHSGTGLKQRGVDDQYWPLKVNPSFAHWLPIHQPGLVVVIRPGKTPLLIRPVDTSFWHGPAPITASHFWQSFEVIECEAESVRSHIQAQGAAYIGDDTELAKQLELPTSAQNPAPLMALLDAGRTIKSAYEIACLKEANRIATRGHQHVAELFASETMSELDLHLAYLQATEQDALETPYTNIVALGTNAAILHHMHYGRDKDASQNQSLLIDAGAMSMGYASDITRTMVRGESPAAKDFAALIAGMDTLAQTLCAQVKPGLRYEDLHNQSHQLLAALLLESGLCTGSAEALVDEGVTRVFFPHGLGHSLGLQVHDVGCRLTPPADINPFLRNTSCISEGQVFTVEPGCYFIDALLAPLKSTPAGALVAWRKLESLCAFGGIRIEDNLVVSRDASINLTRDNWPARQ